MARTYEGSPSFGEQYNSLATSFSTGIFGVVSGIFGVVLGASITFMVMQPISSEKPNSVNAPHPLPALPPTPFIGGEGVPASQMSVGDLNLRGGGGRGSRGAKRALATLVGKLELLSRPNLKLHFELDGEQAKAIAAKLGELNQAETMFSDEAEEFFYGIDRLLTSEQKEILVEIALPVDVGFGPSAIVPEPSKGLTISNDTSVSGASPATRGGGRRDENPFTREANQKRLRDLLSSLCPSVVEINDN